MTFATKLLYVGILTAALCGFLSAVLFVGYYDSGKGPDEAAMLRWARGLGVGFILGMALIFVAILSWPGPAPVVR